MERKKEVIKVIWEFRSKGKEYRNNLNDCIVVEIKREVGERECKEDLSY